MGRLDDLLGGLAGQQMGGRAQPSPTQSGAGMGTSGALIALMPIVLAMLSHRGSAGGAPTQANYAPSAGGGLGDLLGRVLGGAGGGGGAATG